MSQSGTFTQATVLMVITAMLTGSAVAQQGGDGAGRAEAAEATRREVPGPGSDFPRDAAAGSDARSRGDAAGDQSESGPSIRGL